MALDRAFSPIAAQIRKRPGANAMSRLLSTARIPPATRARLRPSRSAAIPLGTSHNRLTIW